MAEYDHIKIEKKWQAKWAEQKLYEVQNDSSKNKYYFLVEFPYPSGDGLHVGHARSYTALDVLARKRRREGFNVLYPIGWDAFGLPTENYAIKTGIHPKEVTKKNTDTFRRQLKSMGYSFDWSREINTTSPEYYKWTQWIFIQMYKKGLAYKSKMPINWCLTCKIGLANEEVVDEKCERCGGSTEKREKEQWMLAITKYADRLHDDLDSVDYWDRIKIQQQNWIGRREGARLTFAIKGSNKKIEVFTTRPDTLFGATYMVLAPEHGLVQELKSSIENWDEVLRYIVISQKKTEIERTAEGKEKSGIELKGIVAINPANNEEIPIYISDYVLAQYGTGAIMAVPAHDERDYEFAKIFNLPIVEVVSGGDISKGTYVGNGVLVNSSEFNGLRSEEAKEKITKAVGGTTETTYKLRDWVFSRQRYWGEPIPMVYCKKCGWVPVPEDQLPVELPEVGAYEPAESGESPLAAIKEWVNTDCPTCEGPASRETDTMPNWAGSSWYYLRYIDPKNTKELAGKSLLEKWTPVDWYNGGMEHTTLHLLYSRFWHKFLFDIGVVPTKEPYAKRTSHGLILAEGGEKMSKSKGNVVNPDDVLKTFGADTLRVYEMFMGPFDQPIPWSTDNMVGSRRFLERVFRLQKKVGDEGNEIDMIVHKTIKKVTDDIEQLKFNTAVSQLMILLNEIEKTQQLRKSDYKIFLQLLAPFAPHITEELWEQIGQEESVQETTWPSFDETLVNTVENEFAVQINGKVRATFIASKDITEEEALHRAMALPQIKKWVEGQTPTRVIFIAGKVLNIVV